MLVSPFTFYRGAALPMAADLSGTPTSGLRVQLCGDAHLSNFGAFASPERQLVFDVNDFDETLPGPFEWDVKRLAASLAVAGRDSGFSTKDRRTIVLAAAQGYRESMRTFADQSLMDVWYAHMDIEQTVGQFRSQVKAKRLKAGQKMMAKAHSRDSMQALGKLTTVVDGHRQFVADPPMIVPIEEIFSDVQADALSSQLHQVLTKYVRSLQSDRRHLVGQFDDGAGGPQGRRGGQRRHPRLGRADGSRRRDRAAASAGEGGPAVGPGRVLRAQHSTTTRVSASSSGST